MADVEKKLAQLTGSKKSNQIQKLDQKRDNFLEKASQKSFPSNATFETLDGFSFEHNVQKIGSKSKNHS